MGTSLRHILLLIVCLLSIVLAGCNSGTQTTLTPKATPTTTAVLTTTPTPTTPITTGSSHVWPSPTTTKGCPAPGQGRPAVFSSYQSGSRQSVIYVENQLQSYQSPPKATTLSYYSVDDNTKKDILKLSDRNIYDAQLSKDGQWVLFILKEYGVYRIQAIRTDGKELQTLYCSRSFYYGNLANLTWSPDEKQITFIDETIKSSVLLLDLTTGKIRHIGLSPYLWLDNQHFYTISGASADHPEQNAIYLVDLNEGDDQTLSQAKKIADIHADNFSLSYNNDTKQLFLARNSFDHEGSIVSLSAYGGPEKLLYRTKTMSYTEVSINATQLLFTVSYDNEKYVKDNGVWHINTDGSNAVHLTTSPIYTYSFIRSDKSWSAISRDFKHFAYRTTNDIKIADSLQVASLQTGAPKTFTVMEHKLKGGLYIVGWTVL